MTDVVTVLVVSGGGFQGQGLVKALRESSRVRVVLADIHRENITRYFADRAYVVPEAARPDEFVSALLDICRREGVGLVLPATGFELLALAQGRDRFTALQVQVAVSDEPFLRLAADKRELYRELAAAGFPVLPTVDPWAPTVSHPVLIGKPLAGWGSRGLVILRTSADVDAHRALAGSHVFQPFLEDADELSADLAIDFEGVASPVGLRRRLRTSGGFAVVSETADHPVAQAAVDALIPWARLRGARGILNVQLLTREREVFLSDVNPRPGTSFVHWIGTGKNPALHLCASLRPDLRPKVLRSRPGQRSVRYLEELRVDPSSLGAPLIRGVVFDLDDTLIPHKAWIAARLEALHALHAGELPDRATFLGESHRLLEERAPGGLLHEVAESLKLPAGLRDKLIASYRASQPSTCEVFPDVLPTIETLQRAGLRVAVLTDNPPESQRAKIEASPLRGRLDAVVYTREEGGEKPDPRGFAAIAARLQLAPSALAMVGDNPHRDVRGAAAAGFGRLFLLRRPGALFSFDADLFGRLPGCPRFEEIETLQRLCAALTVAP